MRLAKVDPSIALRGPKGSSSRSDRASSASGANLSAIQISWTLRETWTRHKIPQNASSFLPAIDRSFDFDPTGGKDPSSTKIRRNGAKRSPKGARKKRKKKGGRIHSLGFLTAFLWTFALSGTCARRLLKIRVLTF